MPKTEKRIKHALTVIDALIAICVVLLIMLIFCNH
jgi:hypothetical protein